MSCNVPTSVPLSQLTSPPTKNTVNKGKDTWNGKETNGKEAL